MLDSLTSIVAGGTSQTCAVVASVRLRRSSMGKTRVEGCILFHVPKGYGREDGVRARKSGPRGTCQAATRNSDVRRDVPRDPPCTVDHFHIRVLTGLD